MFFINIILFLYLIFFPIEAYGKDRLTVYTYRSLTNNNELGELLKREFEKICNCEIIFSTSDDSLSLLNRLYIEKNKNYADVVLGLEYNIINLKNIEQFFCSYNYKEFEKIYFKKKIKSNFFLPYDYGYFSFIYNKKKNHNLTKNFFEFIKNKDFSISYPDPRLSTIGLDFLLWIKKIYKNNYKEAIFYLSKKRSIITKNWGESYNLFLNGEIDFVFSYTTSPIFHIIEENNSNYDYIDFNEGHYVQFEVVGISKNSKNYILSKKFIKFLLSDYIQNKILFVHWMNPIVKNKFNKINNPKKEIKIFNPLEVSKIYYELIKIWKRNIFF
ncbi:MAG: thiamine ABC transporter substrate-binding protein [Enterobacteriaceae bacterium]